MSQFMKIFKQNSKKLPSIKSISIQVVKIWDYNCKDQIWVPSPIGRWTEAQRAQNNEFVENGLENWTLVNQTNIRRDSDD